MASLTINEAGFFDVAVNLVPAGNVVVAVGSKTNIAMTIREPVASTIKLVDEVRARSAAQKSAPVEADMSTNVEMSPIIRSAFEDKRAISRPRRTRSTPRIGPVRDSSRPMNL
jgi:hypothetical protein